MNTRISLAWGLGLVLAAVSGVAAKTAAEPPPAASRTETLSAIPGQSATDLAAPVIIAPLAFTDRPVSAAADNPGPKDRLLPPGSHVSAWLIELAKLAQAGIE